jgi:heptosyltransferase-2
LGKKNGMHLFNGLDVFHRYIPWDSRNALQLFDMARSLKGLRFDRGIVLPHSFRSAFLFFLAGIRERVGYARNHRGFMLTQTVPEPGGVEPTVEHYLRIVDRLGGRRLCDAPALVVTADEEEHFFEAFPDLAQPYAAFIPGAQYGPSKRWPEGHFAALSDLLAERYGLKVLILPGKGEEKIAEDIGARCRRKKSVAILDMGIRELKVCLSRASVVITNDTGPRHIAAALGVPTVVLIGPMDDRYTSYPNASVRQLARDVPCKPCNRKACDRGHECLAGITPQEVADVVGAVLPRPPLPGATTDGINARKN